MTRQLHVVAVLFVACVGLGVAGCGGSPDPDRAETSSARTEGPVDIGDRSLLLRCQGAGAPTVLLEAGLGGDLTTWDSVLAPVSSRTRACAYNRANVGASDPAPTPRTTTDMVDDLTRLLTAADEPPPYVLVGFSFGGLVVQQFAATHPDDVAGLVLVESNHPDEARQFEAHLTRKQILADRAEVAANPEGVDVFSSFDEVRAAGRVPDVPLVVVTAGAGEDWPPGWDPTVFDRLRSRQQADLAAMVTGGRQVFARQSGHDVPHDQPEVVVRAIEDVLGRVSTGGPPR